MGRLAGYWLALAALVAGSASARVTADDLVDATDPQALVRIIQDLGYRADLEVDSEGDPLIRSSVGGTQFALLFYGCTDNHDRCGILLFKAGWDLDRQVDMNVINRWNATRLFGRAYLDEVMDPWIELVLNLQGGVTRTQFESTFEWWGTSVGQFEEEIGV